MEKNYQKFNVARKGVEYEVIVDFEDYERIKDYNWFGWTTPRHTTIYVVASKNNKVFKLHRLILNAPKGTIVDHINGNALDNRKSNLRIVSNKENNMNAKKRRSAQSSKYKGVHFCKVSKKWKAQIQKDIEKHSLGTFNTEKEAAEAYNVKAVELFKEYAFLNVLAEIK